MRGYVKLDIRIYMMHCTWCRKKREMKMKGNAMNSDDI